MAKVDAKHISNRIIAKLIRYNFNDSLGLLRTENIRILSVVIHRDSREFEIKVTGNSWKNVDYAVSIIFEIRYVAGISRCWSVFNVPTQCEQA